MSSVMYIGNEVTKLKSFGEQLVECRENGTLFKERCGNCGCVLFMCKKYGGQCRSDKCYMERLQRINGERVC